MSENKAADYGSTAVAEDDAPEQGEGNEDEEWELNKVLETIGL